MSSPGTYIVERDKEFLKFMKSRYPLFHLSNVFFRDLHYGVMAFLEQNDQRTGYTSSEGVTWEVVDHFVQQEIFRPIDSKTWLLLYPAFKAVAPKKPAPAKPAGAAAGARPAAAASKPAAPQPAKTGGAQPGGTQAAPTAKQAETKPDTQAGTQPASSDAQPA